MTAYYNEIDPFAAQWLRNLIAAGHIAYGVVDERSIEDIVPSELAEFTQCHFFAGVGVWSHALRRAGWPDDRPVWTGSCPCQPFSAAGKGAGFADERHLWPAFYHLIVERRPQVVFGEQVASKDGLGWFDLVQADLEGAGYACAAVDTCAASFGAPHIRQRLYWVADTDNQRRQGRVSRGPDQGREDQLGYSGRGGAVGGVVNADKQGLQRREQHRAHRCESGEGGTRLHGATGKPSAGDVVGLADTDGWNPGAEREQRSGQYGQQPEDGSTGWVAYAAGKQKHKEQRRPPTHEGGRGADISSGRGLVDAGAATRPTNGFWRDADWLLCRDGKWRPVEPGTFPLAYGATSRVGRLRAYGNAIVAPQAQAFIESYLG
jgi:DNA (cytosine-5)-methyltransferase 1